LVGEKESEILKFLGTKEKAESYKLLLYGQNVSMTFESKDEIVDKIKITFDSSDIESISNATAEQLGQDGEIVNETIKWVYEEINVELSQNDEKIMIEILK